jgi:hypothetical protein
MDSHLIFPHEGATFTPPRMIRLRLVDLVEIRAADPWLRISTEGMAYQSTGDNGNVGARVTLHGETWLVVETPAEIDRFFEMPRLVVKGWPKLDSKWFYGSDLAIWTVVDITHEYIYLRSDHVDDKVAIADWPGKFHALMVPPGKETR